MSAITLDQPLGTPFDQLSRPVPVVPVARPRVVRVSVPAPVVPKPRVRVHRDVVAPPRSLQQRQEALDRANVIRWARAELKQRVKDGLVLAADVLADPPEFAGAMKVMDLLCAMPMVGPVKARAFLRYVEASESKTLAGISFRQRSELVALLRGRR